MLLALDELDAVVDQVGREVFELLLGELDLLEPRDDLVIGEEALLLPRLDELVSSSISGREMSTVSTLSPTSSRGLTGK